MQALARVFAIGLLLLGLASGFLGQTPSVGLTPAPLPASDEIYACPMDPDVRGHDPGTCPRCGMKLVAGIPDPVEYSMDLKVTPPGPKPLQPARFSFTVRDPWKDRPVSKFQSGARKAVPHVRGQPGPEVLRARPSRLPRGRNVHLRYRVPEAGHVPHSGRFLSGWRDAAADRQDCDGARPGAGCSQPDARLFHQGRRQHAGGTGDRSAAAHRPHQDHDVFQA